MTDKQKLDQLFQAALKSNLDPGKSLERAFPDVMPAKVASVPRMPVTASGSEIVSTADSAAAKIAVLVEAPPRRELLVEPMPNAGLDEASSAELGTLLDSQLKRVADRRRREMMVTLAVIGGLTGGGFGWFIHSPSRVAAFNSAMTEVRAISDIKGMMAKYQVALDKIGKRGKEIDKSSLSLGSDPAPVKQGDDPNMVKETEALTGEKGADVGERDKQLREKFGKIAKSPAVSGQVAQTPSSTANR